MIDDLIKTLRTEGEELFYEFSSFLDREEAEKASIIGLKSSIKNRLETRKSVLKRKNSLLEKAKTFERDSSFERGYSSGSIDVLNVQIKAEKDYIKELEMKEELIKFL